MCWVIIKFYGKTGLCSIFMEGLYNLVVFLIRFIDFSSSAFGCHNADRLTSSILCDVGSIESNLL